jgi:O-acetyl-ADP-ribose deacetylase (regulator of RNase III)
MSIQYVIGDATSPVGAGPKVIVHVCNDAGKWGRGFVLAVSKKWPKAEAAYRDWHKHGGDQPFELGQVQFVEVSGGLWVANVIGQHGLRRSGRQPPVRYDAIATGLARVAEFAAARRASVHMPRIGCGLAGGRWEEIEPLIERHLVASGTEVVVYDLARIPVV